MTDDALTESGSRSDRTSQFEAAFTHFFVAIKQDFGENVLDDYFENRDRSAPNECLEDFIAYEDALKQFFEDETPTTLYEYLGRVIVDAMEEMSAFGEIAASDFDGELEDEVSRAEAVFKKSYEV